MPMAAYGSFVALIPAPLGIGALSLADGSSVQGFLCEACALAVPKTSRDWAAGALTSRPAQRQLH